MQLHNFIPFPIFCFENRDPDGNKRGVFLVRGTFRLPDRDSGAPILPVPEQPKIEFRDVFRGDSATTSLLTETDLAPFKPGADIYFNATAYAPEGLPAPEWDVAATLGTATKRLRVTGPRHWRRRRWGGWKLDDPEPVDRVPLTYEQSFGGSYTGGDEEQVTYMANPVGKGYFDPKAAPRDQPVAAPQVMDPEAPVHEPGEPMRPESLAPVARHWQPRLARAGTMDQAWVDHRAPKLPADYCEGFNNCAHEDLIYEGYPEGDEDVVLEGLCPGGGRLHFALPRYRVGLLMRFCSGRLHIVPLVLDTIYFDLRAESLSDFRVHLTWRANYPLDEPIRVLESRLVHPGQTWMERVTWQ
ncbi:DUF2169 domain-containing protein [Sulfidibacter corallicola]|uniref:DUF2169 domain-containing protein n=1 Tax=Sulfidibacter corallicola TaxID=2818388 RepID=A0A8A4TBU8_SULCO|nr:DUF2169 domain-containing protein [Sulfidibacter corallicola]QTD47589.1 DUF2169 domain-containing protein [Sulfidibacter corallicola]